MRKGGGKAKGASFERDVCKRLSLWITQGAREDCFWRSAMSGGRATVGRRKGKDHIRQAGDITATSPEGHVLTDKWYIECKNVKDLAITAALFNGVGTLAGFWREAVEQASHFKRMPMIIAKQNMQKTVVFVPSAHLLSPTGIAMYPRAMLGRWCLLRADIIDFDGMLKLPFQEHISSVDRPFLQPGEIAHILGAVTKKRKIKRERLPLPVDRRKVKKLKRARL
jgi:hypothetical protein